LAQATKKRATAPRRKKVASKKKASARATSRASGSNVRGKGKTAKPGRQSAAESRVLAEDLLTQRAALGQMSRRLREAFGLLCFFAGLIALLALASFYQPDPGWSHTGNVTETRNSMGVAGAWFADVALFLFGYMAYLVPCLLFGAGYLMFRDTRPARVRRGYRPFAFGRNSWHGHRLVVSQFIEPSRHHIVAASVIFLLPHISFWHLVAAVNRDGWWWHSHGVCLLSRCCDGR